MRKLILKMSLSSDGFVCGPNGEMEWLYKTMDKGITDWTVSKLWQSGVHIMGSRTFHDMAAYWPYSSEPFAAPMNEIPKVVFSKKGFVSPDDTEQTTTALKDAIRFRPEHVSWEQSYSTAVKNPPAARTWTNFRVAGGDLTTEINRLKQEEGKNILAHGGASFARSLIGHGLVDEFILVIHPVALGKGLSVFSSLPSPLYLTLTNTTTFKSGIIGNIYVPKMSSAL